MHDDERVDIQPAARTTRMTALWVFLGVVAMDLVVSLFRPQPSLIECTDGSRGGDCVTRYTDPVLPTWLGLALLATGFLVVAGVFVRTWQSR